VEVIVSDGQYNMGGGQSKAPNLIEEQGGENLLDAGLRAADRGDKIFPVDNQKHPLVSDWTHVATTDRATITAWRKHSPVLIGGS
jgi:hypothetical protein